MATTTSHITQILSYGPMVTDLPDLSDRDLSDWALELSAQLAHSFARYGEAADHVEMLRLIGVEVIRRNA